MSTLLLLIVSGLFGHTDNVRCANAAACVSPACAPACVVPVAAPVVAPAPVCAGAQPVGCAGRASVFVEVRRARARRVLRRDARRTGRFAIRRGCG